MSQEEKTPIDSPKNKGNTPYPKNQKKLQTLQKLLSLCLQQPKDSSRN